MENILVITIAFVIIVIVIAIFLSFVPVGLWISAMAANTKISLFTLIGMRLRRVKPALIIKPLIRANKANVEVSVSQLESHYLAGGNVDNIVNALVASQRANLELSFERAAAIDLAGRNVFEAVKQSVTPKVIETPWISAVAMNGIEVKVIARVTVKTDLERLVGGAGEGTIIARIGEGIVTTVGSSKSHKEVLENPDMISQGVLDKGLDVGTSYEILSIDIADIDIGRNVGAQLQIAQAEADKQIAQAKAEERRAIAIAQEQEMKAKVEEMRAKVVESEAQVPLAIAGALSDGNMGVFDYLNMENKQADTGLKQALSKSNISLTAETSNNKKDTDI